MWVNPIGEGRAILGPAYYNKAFALSPSARIGPAAYPASAWRMGNVKMGSQSATMGWRFGYWNNGTEGFLGLRFLIGSNTHYGWARMSVLVDPDANYSAHLTGYAYESDRNTAIHASNIPEPGTLGLLAGGVLGLAIWRRRKQQA